MGKIDLKVSKMAWNAKIPLNPTPRDLKPTRIGYYWVNK
jgi:hypothetical protein